ncbi:site-specific integrase [Sphaerotilus montanus]|nr:site-specific integrase [Sphaerotilus montanus]
MDSMIEAGKLGRPLIERIELVRLIRESLLNYVDGGGRRKTVLGCIEKLRLFLRWADESSTQALSLATVEECYRHWCDALLHRARVGRGLLERTAYGYGSKVGWVLDRVLGRATPLIKSTRLRSRKRGPRAVSPTTDKQNLEEAFAFGRFLLDLADGLSVEAIWGPLPLQILMRNGKTLELWSGLKSPNTLKPPNPKWPAQSRQAEQRAAQNRADWQADRTYRTRYSVINLRITAEMFMLMGQSGVNLAQSHQLRMDQWRFKPSSQGYEIRTYKHRRWGPVVFQIYSEYREVFDRYLHWRKAIFPEDPDGLLFPSLGKNGTPAQRRSDAPPNFKTLQKISKRAGVAFVGPQALRSTNVNWMLRRTADPDLTAEEKQHAKQTLIRVYEKPSLQRAMVQTQVYWAEYDPTMAPPGPGTCTGKNPHPVADMPATAVQPDCMTPSGCLFCDHQRDIDSQDHVWSLASFRFLKSFEEVEAKSNMNQNPAQAAINRITAKLNFIEASSSERAQWVKEALLRLDEERYHPAWKGLIESHVKTPRNHYET